MIEGGWRFSRQHVKQGADFCTIKGARKFLYFLNSDECPANRLPFVVLVRGFLLLSERERTLEGVFVVLCLDKDKGIVASVLFPGLSAVDQAYDEKACTKVRHNYFA